jgi:UDP-N-acetylmuramate--alanine ligase
VGHPINRFRVRYRDEELGEFTLHVPGVHNVLNATAAIAVGVGLDVEVDAIRSALDGFRGVDRRFQLRGQAAGVSVIDDYGHHPTEIRATLGAAKQCGFGKIHVVFQPHRYTRTRDLMEEFATAFGDADSLFVLDIYAASEKPIEGITGEILARRIGEGGKGAQYASSFAAAATLAAAAAQDGDMILTLGAGSVSQLGDKILERLSLEQIALEKINA